MVEGELDWAVIIASVMWGIGTIAFGVMLYRQITSGSDDKY